MAGASSSVIQGIVVSEAGSSSGAASAGLSTGAVEVELDGMDSGDITVECAGCGAPALWSLLAHGDGLCPKCFKEGSTAGASVQAENVLDDANRQHLKMAQAFLEQPTDTEGSKRVETGTSHESLDD